jgi:predicted nucleic-acid-binding Zn-ribbon protein
MKHSLTCPKCAHRRFAVVPRFDIPSHDSENGTEFIPVVSVRTGSKRVERGHFEVWVCERCGFSEFYAQNLHGLFDVAQRFPGEVLIVAAVEAPPRGAE